MEPSRIYGGNAILVRCVLRFVRNEGDLHLVYPCNNKTFFLVNCLQFYLVVDSSMIQVNAHNGTAIGLQHDILFDGGLEHDSS